MLVAIVALAAVLFSLSSIDSETVSASHSTQGHLSLAGTLNLQAVVSTGTVAQIAPTITFTNIGSSSTTQVAVNADGTYILQGVPAGTYRVDAAASGFLSARFATVAVTSSSLILPDHRLTAGDVNGDGGVTIRDISAAAASFGQGITGRTDGQGRFVDVNGDGIVSILDISAIASNFGQAGPEPWDGAIATRRLAEKPPVGTNIGVLRYWIAETPFVNVFKGASDWISYPDGDSSTFSDSAVVPLRSDGFPSQVPFTVGTSTQLHDVRSLIFSQSGWEWPTGDYTFIYEGDGDVWLDYDVGFTQFTSAGTYTVNIPSTNSFGIQLGITRSNVNDAVRNIRLILPGFASVAATQPFDPAYVDTIDDFSVVRFTEWAPVNDSADFVGNRATTTWANRIQPNHSTQATEQGVAYEYIAALSNLASVDPWLSIPHRADDNYVTQLATLMRDSLDSDRKVYIEYSNEVWNLFDFPFSIQYEWASQMGINLGLASSTQPRIAGQRYTAKRSAEIFRIFETVWGDQSGRLVNVLAGFTAQTAVTSEILSAFHLAQINGVDINPTSVAVDAFAVGPYFGGNIAQSIFDAGQSTSTTVSQILDQLAADVPTEGIAFAQSSQAVIQPYGIPMIAYEGGQSLWPLTDASRADLTLVTKLHDANRDPRIYDIYRAYFDGWYAAGGDLFMHYKHIGKMDNWQTFPTLEYQDQDLATAHKHRFLLDLIAEFENGTRPLP